MCDRNWPSAVFTILWLLFSAGLLQAEEAVLKDGQRLPGILTLAANGRLVFSTKETGPLSWGTVQQIDFGKARSAPTPLTGLRQILLSGEQSLTGKFLRWDKDGLRFQLLGMDQRVVPLASIVGMRHVPGVIPLLEEDFSDGLTAWKVEGKPALLQADKASQKTGLILNRAGQSISYVPTDPIESGKVGMDFVLPTSAAKGRWVLEVIFAEDNEPTAIRLTVRGDGRGYVVEAPAGSKDQPAHTCKAGRQRAWIEFGPKKTLVTLDDIVLSQADVRGAVKGLPTLRLACVNLEGEEQTPFTIEAVSMVRAQTDRKHPSGSPDQDEVWLRSGDQLFGRIASVRRQEIDLEIRGRHSRMSWNDVVGIYPQPGNPPPRRLEGEWVRVRLRCASEEVSDELEGVLTKLDGDRLMLRHLALGEIAFDRAQLHRLRRLFFGQRIELDNGSHHLGEKERPVPSIQPPRAEGHSLSKTFRLEAVPTSTRFLVTVIQLKGPGDGIGTELERGELRTEVWMNGERVDYLNKLVDRAVARPQRLSVTIPKNLLRASDNVLELRQTPEAGTDHYENCGLSQMMIETEP